jgi:hypothetical protein
VLGGLLDVGELLLQICANKRWISYTLCPITTKTYGRQGHSTQWISAILSLRTVTWSLTFASSFLRAPSVSLTPEHIEGRNQAKTQKRHGNNTERPSKLTFHHGLEVVRDILCLLLGLFHLLLQGGNLLRLAGHGLLHALDLLHSFDSGLQ